MPSFDVNVGVGQGSALSPILLALYLSSFLYILENHLKNLKILISILSFVDNSLFISQSKSFQISNSCLFYSYNIMLNLLLKFGLIIEYSVFYFTRLQESFNPPPLDLFSISSPILYSKDTWKYLGFIFNKKLLFHYHINFYSNKTMSTIKCMKILSNSVQGLNPLQKYLLYRSCILPIALYGF